jgi:hypothetical protein
MVDQLPAKSDAKPETQVATPAGPVTPTPTQAENDAFATHQAASTLPRPPIYHKWDNSPFQDPSQVPPTPTWP